MPISNVSEIGPAWAKGVANKAQKWEGNTRDSRARVLEGLRAIGASPGPTFSAAVSDTSRINGQVWATKVNGKQDKFASNWLKAINS